MLYNLLFFLSRFQRKKRPKERVVGLCWEKLSPKGPKAILKDLTLEGGIFSVMFRRALGKSQTTFVTFVKQN